MTSPSVRRAQPLTVQPTSSTQRFPTLCGTVRAADRDVRSFTAHLCELFSRSVLPGVWAVDVSICRGRQLVGIVKLESDEQRLSVADIQQLHARVQPGDVLAILLIPLHARPGRMCA